MKWITREHPKIDRIACPWLIRRFVDNDAEIIYVPFDKVISRAKELDAIPFDLPNVEYPTMVINAHLLLPALCSFLASGR